MLQRLIVGGIVVMMAGFGCATSKSPQPVAVEQPRGPVIVRLVGQHQTVTVTAGPKGPLYTAQTTDGQTIVANASLAELRTKHPDVYQFIQPAVATDASVVPATPRQAGSSSGPESVPEKLMLD